MTEKQIITDQERIQHLEDKIKRQRADLSRLYRERDDYVESLKKDLAHRELMADEWHRLFAETRTKYRKVKELWRKSEARYNGLVEKLVEKGIIQE